MCGSANKAEGKNWNGRGIRRDDGQYRTSAASTLSNPTAFEAEVDTRPDSSLGRGNMESMEMGSNASSPTLFHAVLIGLLHA